MRLGSERTEASEWQKLFRSPSTHLEAEDTADWVELKVAVALSLILSRGGGGGDKLVQELEPAPLYLPTPQRWQELQA